MANFLTLGLIGVITGSADSPLALLWLFLGPCGVGTIAGLLVGRMALRTALEPLIDGCSTPIRSQPCCRRACG